MKIRDIETNFNPNNADDIERFENAYEEIQNDFNKLQKQEIKRSEFIRTYGGLIRKFLNVLFGEETSKKILENENEFDNATDTLFEVATAIQENDKTTQLKYEKYMPNRVTRRKK